MRKFIIIGTTLAALVVPSVASADVPRYQSQTETFTMTQPAGAYDQWSNVWTHDFTVEVNPCNDTFEGTGKQTGSDQRGDYTADWTITGKFLANNKVSFTATREDNLILKLDNALMDGNTKNVATHNVPSVTLPIEEKLTSPTPTGASSYKNHGEYVKAMSGGSDAAHACIGMPINSSK